MNHLFQKVQGKVSVKKILSFWSTWMQRKSLNFLSEWFALMRIHQNDKNEIDEKDHSKEEEIVFKKFSKDCYRKKKFCWIFTLQENFPIRAKKRPRLVKNCHGPRKSQFFATLQKKEGKNPQLLKFFTIFFWENENNEKILEAPSISACHLIGFCFKNFLIFGNIWNSSSLVWIQSHSTNFCHFLIKQNLHQLNKNPNFSLFFFRGWWSSHILDSQRSYSIHNGTNYDATYVFHRDTI